MGADSQTALRTPSLANGREGLRTAIRGLEAAFGVWRESHSKQALTRMKTVYADVRPHLIKLAPSTPEGRENLNFLDRLMESPTRNIDVVIALLRRIFTSLRMDDCEDRLFGTVNTAVQSWSDSPAVMIDNRCREKGWTKEQLAARAGVGVRQVYVVKREGNATVNTIIAIAGALECPPAALLPRQSFLKRQS